MRSRDKKVLKSSLVALAFEFPVALENRMHALIDRILINVGVQGEEPIRCLQPRRGLYKYVELLLGYKCAQRVKGLPQVRCLCSSVCAAASTADRRIDLQSSIAAGSPRASDRKPSGVSKATPWSVGSEVTVTGTNLSLRALLLPAISRKRKTVLILIPSAPAISEPSDQTLSSQPFG